MSSQCPVRVRCVVQRAVRTSLRRLCATLKAPRAGIRLAHPPQRPRMKSCQDSRPGDLISVSRAATIAERSERTIRRWASPEVAKLQRWEGEPPDNGGPAPVLVSERDLMVVLAVSGQQPRPDAAVTPDGQPVANGLDTTGRAPDMTERTPDSVQIAVLEGKLMAAELRGKLAAAMAERDALREQVRALRDQVAEERRRWVVERQDHREDLERERAQVAVLQATLDAQVRGYQLEAGLPWWRRLLGGPVGEGSAAD